jgi:hypothetical protein
MSEGDYGDDDGGAFDLNHNGTSADELLLFASITDNDGATSTPGDGSAKRSGCLLPAALLALSIFGLLAV